MKKEIINHFLYFAAYFLFLTIANSLYSFSYWPLYIGGLVGLFMSNLDHLMHVFVFQPQELTSIRVIQFIKNKQYKEALVLMYDTREERIGLIFHTSLFQIIFTVLTFWVVSSSGSLFARGLVLSYLLSLVIFNLKKYINKNKKVILYDKKVLSDKLSEIINLKFKEEYNVHNAVAAILVAKEIGISEDKIANAIKTFKGVEGRMEEIKNMLGIKIIIDFAHTPNALENVLKTLKEQKNKKSKLITIFGCAGERDIMKRPMMGKISSEIADISIFTTEDPRHEDINDIFGQMLKGVKNKSKNIHLIPDRREAINFAINKIAKRGDIVAICGKGHEKSMNFNGVEHPWSDKEAVTRTLMKKAAVLGLGLEGKDLVNFLLKTGADITIYDERQKEELDLTGIDTNKISIICGVGVFSSDTLNHFETIYRSPGIYRFRKEIKSIENTGVKISSAIKLFFELCPATIIGVTGTKGKGTTSTLIYNILKKANKKVYLAGNIGKPYLSLLSKLKKSDFVVLELSSFQLIDLHKSPHIAVVLNITSDHLDWHKNRDEYVSAKSNVVRFQHKDDFAVINSEYITSKSFSKLTKGKVMYFSKDGLDAKFKKKILLRGEHNLENIAAAVNVARILRISDKVISKSVTGFKGLEHRLELVKSVDQVSFYNDSFSTNPEPTIAAVNSFGNSMTLILGGFDKGLDYQKMGKEIANNSKVNNIILIGDTAEKIKKSLLSNNFKGKIWEMGKTSMKKIVLKAKSTTVKGGIVILSPASASFDMFKDYKERGLLFKEAVYELNKS